MPYTLSNAQQKELLVRGQPLLIALPLPQSDPETDAEALREARRLLVVPEGVQIVSAQINETWVESPTKHEWPPQTLAQWLGAIVPDGRLDQVASWQVLSRHVLIVALVRGPAERQPLKAPQWPGGRLIR